MFFFVLHLHSIMYLLILADWRISTALVTFTFHNVSINSYIQFLLLWCISNLHSIMYLLIPVNFAWYTKKSAFTFHNVSINSRNQELFKDDRHTNLHSIMYLLIRQYRLMRLSEGSYLHSIMYLLIRHRLSVTAIIILIYIP